MSYLVLARKWRPQTFDDLIGQEHVARILKNAIVGNKVAHAYIFSGPRGVGKTSTARILAKALNCIEGPTPDPCNKCVSCTSISDSSSIDVFEIDGASNTGVDNIRDLRERVRYAPSAGRYKVYIIDEVHMLSTSAFNALLKTLEEPPPHVIFVLATTEPKKIPATVISRCQHLPFRRISGQKIKERLSSISGSEGIKISGSALDMIARSADGSMRDSLTILDQIVSFSDNITAGDIKDLLGITDAETLSKLAASVIDGDRKSVINAISELINSGTDIKSFARDFLQFVRNLLIAKITDGAEEAMDLSEEESAAINGIRDKTGEEHIAVILSELIKSEPAVRSAFFPRIVFEMALIKLCLLNHLKSVDEALRIVSGGQIPSPAATTSGGMPPKTEKKESKDKERCIRNAAGASSIQDIWNGALAKIEETNHPLACKLREGKVSSSGSEIKIVFNGGLSVHADSVKENLPAIRKVFEELSGRKINLKIETAVTNGPSKKDLKEKALQNPIVKEALELFEGRIVDVIPLNNKGGDNV